MENKERKEQKQEHKQQQKDQQKEQKEQKEQKQQQQQLNTRRNCDYCVEKKVRCSGKIDGGSCAYCARKKHVCVFSIKQKPGPKCLRHVGGEEGSSAEESPAVTLPSPVAAISSAAAALTLSPNGGAGGATTGKSSAAKGGGGRRASSSSSSSSSKRKSKGSSGGGSGRPRGDKEEQQYQGGPPASFADLGPHGGASIPGIPRTISGGAPSMAVAVSPPGFLGTANGGGGGGDQRLSVGTLGEGNGGSFISGLSGLAAPTEEDDEAVFGKILQVLDSDTDDEQQEEPSAPPAKKAKTYRGLHASLHASLQQQFQDLQSQRKPRGGHTDPTTGTGTGHSAPDHGGSPPGRLSRQGSLNPSATTAQRIAAHAAAAAAGAAAAIAKAAPALPLLPQQQQQLQPLQQQQRLLSRMDSAGSWRRLLNPRGSFSLNGGGSSTSNGGGGGGGGGGGLSSTSSWINRPSDGGGGAPSFMTSGGGGGGGRDPADPFLGGFRGGVGPVAEPLDTHKHARSHSYGLGDWAPPTDIFRDPTLDVLPGMPGMDDGVVTPLTGGIVAGRDHQF